MKKVKIILIAVLTMLVTLMTIFLCMALFGGGTFWGNFTSLSVSNHYTLLNTREIDMEDVTQLSIDYTGTGYDVYLVPGEGNSIVMEEYFNVSDSPELYAEVSENGNTVKIRGQEQHQRQFFILFSKQGYIKLYLPLAVYEQLQVLTVKNTSGNVELGFEDNSSVWEAIAPATDLSVTTTSGNIEISSIKATDTSLKANSGNIAVDWLRATDTKMNTTSGNVNLDSFAGSSLTVGCNSGNIDIGDCEGNIELTTTSGSKNVAFCAGDMQLIGNSSTVKIVRCEGNIEIENSSGNVQVDECTGNVKVALNSGNTKLGTIQGSVQVTSTSGNITVRELMNACSATSNSGNIDITVTDLNGNIRLQGTSGGTRLNLPADSSFQFEVETTSGDIRTYFDDSLDFNEKGNAAIGTVGDHPDSMISCSFSSGSVTVRDSSMP